MNNISNDLVLFLTACVNPNGMAQTAVQDSQKRLEQYINAINFYIKQTSFPILVVENTNIDLSKYFINEIQMGRLECLSFSGNNYDRKLGKGYGEGIIINYAFSNSKMLSKYNYIVKISGRHKVNNINRIINIAELFLRRNNNLIICEINNKKKFARSDMYISSKSFYKIYLNSSLKVCDDSKNIWFENVLFDCVKKSVVNGFQFLFLPLALDQHGISGTNGKEFKSPRKRRHLHFFFNMLMFKFNFYRI